MLAPENPKSRSYALLAGCIVLAGVLVAGLLFPAAVGFGVISNKASSTVENVSSQLIEGAVPEITTITDTTGRPIAALYDQQRIQVGYNDISPNMVRSIVSIEDHRFFEHDGVDWHGTIRAFLRNSSSGSVQQGASTIDQQYIKNYQLLVLAHTDAERQAATADTAARKLREVRMALTLERTLRDQAERKGLNSSQAKQEAKKEIITRYLNLVPFGNNAYGIEVAARTYFNKSAKDLSIPESAMLAGMVQSSSALDPYSNPQAVLARRNVVLDTLVQNDPSRAAQYEAAKNAPLGVVPQPASIPQGCIGANDNGFFCDYALQFLAENGFSRDNVLRGGYTIRTTLDPGVQQATINGIRSVADPQLPGVADVMSVLAPGQDSHDVLSMGSNRVYGLNRAQEQTVQPEPFSMVGDGGGSTFKIFTTAAAMEKGLGTGSNLDVPATFQASGMGSSGGANGCPENTYCVKNDGKYPASMSVTNALATSPNTAFVKLLQKVGVPSAVDMAIRLGMRSYAQPGTAPNGTQSLADYFKQGNLGSFTLGPTAVNALELSNVAATLSSHGMWCPPNPIASITLPKRDDYGNPVLDPNGAPATKELWQKPGCQQVVEPGLADTLANAMSHDDQGGGTSAASARAAGWHLPVSAKTGTTETYRSAAFLGFTNKLAAATYIYDDSDSPGPLCSGPLRECSSGDLYGGSEPGRTWYNTMVNLSGRFGPVSLPPVDPRYVSGTVTGAGNIPDVSGLTASDATAKLQQAGFTVQQQTTDSATVGAGIVAFTAPERSAVPGSLVTIYVSTGQSDTATQSAPPAPTTIDVPGQGPVTIPPLQPGG